MGRGPLSIAVSGAIGLASEAASAFKHRHDVVVEDYGDNDEWMLDETQDQLNATDRGDANTDVADVDGIVNLFLQRHPSTSQPPAYTETALLQLTNPVIIPQRRPHSKARGFVRAYAPALDDRAIDQRMFIDFLKGFDASIKKEKLFIVANIAIGAGVTTATAFIGENFFLDVAALAAHTMIEMGRRMYITKKLNTYLLDMNEHLFKPRGLYALIMAYKPKSSNAVEVVDLDTSVALSAFHNGDSGSRFRIDSGAVWDESQMPIAAPLIFPALQSASAEQRTNAFKDVSSFFSEYSDRRAQAVFSAQNPNSSLNVVPRKKFASRYSDPNHPVNTGGPLAIITGGKVSIDNKRRAERERQRVAEGRPKEEGAGGVIGGIKRRLQENVLYLMIIDYPSEEQLAAAATVDAKLKAMKEQQAQH